MPSLDNSLADYNIDPPSSDFKRRWEELLCDDVKLLETVTDVHQYILSKGLDLALLVDFTLWGLPKCTKNPFIRGMR
jgi:hypothetical protein